MAELHSMYTKDELLTLCEELQVDKISMSDNTRKLVSKIIDNLNAEGVPEDDECSDLLYNFLIDSEFIDDPDAEEEEAQEEEPQLVEEITLPDCYGFADDRDKSCKICRVFTQCMNERIEIRQNELPCFGTLYDNTAEECKLCLEAGPCRTASLQTIKVK